VMAARTATDMTKRITLILFSLALLAGVLLIAPGTPAGRTPAPAPATSATLTAVTRPAAPVRPAAALDAHQLHLLHVAQEKPRAVLTAVTGSSLGSRVLAEAETRAGDWYVYGTDGPSTFDCSGLVYWSAAQIGLSLPRDTYGMLASAHLVRVSSPQRGDLAFFGTGHVEIYVSGHTTFGAQQTGTRVGFHTWSAFWAPTAFYRVS
jgi:peptidoglycan DL-endopeptidase CwlO